MINGISKYIQNDNEEYINANITWRIMDAPTEGIAGFIYIDGILPENYFSNPEYSDLLEENECYQSLANGTACGINMGFAGIKSINGKILWHTGEGLITKIEGDTAELEIIDSDFNVLGIGYGRIIGAFSGIGTTSAESFYKAMEVVKGFASEEGVESVIKLFKCEYPDLNKKLPSFEISEWMKIISPWYAGHVKAYNMKTDNTKKIPIREFIGRFGEEHFKSIL